MNANPSVGSRLASSALQPRCANPSPTDRRAFLHAAAATGLAVLSPVARAQEPPPAANLGLLLYSYGIRSRAEKETGFADPARFLSFAKERGASAVQMPLGVRSEADTTEVRKACDRLGVRVEGIVSPPKDEKADRERFEAELATARACGAGVVRSVALGGRRYEVFEKPDDYAAFAKRAEESLRRAEPVARRLKVVVAVENHKDFRTDEQVDLLKRLASEWVGVCVDTGNNLALLEEPLATVEALAPFARTVHLKDIGLEEAPDGFRMAEVPLGRGCLDLKAIVATLRKANPKVPFHLEMFTRDPLPIPCLTEKYWATMGTVPGRDLARSLARVRKFAGKEPLPRMTGLTVAEQQASEDRNVRDSFAFAARSRLIPG